MLRKFLLTSLGVLAMGGTALASDLPSSRYAPVAPIVPVFTWTGFYVGLNAGVAWDTSNSNNNRPIFIPAGTFPDGFAGATTVLPGNCGLALGGNCNRSRAGFAGGGQAGYNYQFGAWVVGVETDIQWADLNRNNGNNNLFFAGAPVIPPVVITGAGVPPGFALTSFNNNRIDWFGTLRGRFGYAWDRSLFYFTGGFAYGGGGGNNNICAVAVAFGCGGSNNTRGGYTLGGGWEYAFNNYWTFKVEGLFVNLDQNNRNNGVLGVYTAPFVSAAGTVAAGTVVFVPGVNNTKNSNEFGVVRAGLNYKF